MSVAASESSLRQRQGPLPTVRSCKETTDQESIVWSLVKAKKIKERKGKRKHKERKNSKEAWQSREVKSKA